LAAGTVVLVGGVCAIASPAVPAASAANIMLFKCNATILLLDPFPRLNDMAGKELRRASV
jgi:hypothetical protein